MKGKKASVKFTKKGIDTYKDPYLPKDGQHEMAACKRCHAIYHNKRWSMDEALYKRSKENKNTLFALCPACRKIRDNYAEGFVTLKGDYLKEHKQDILNLIKNEEERAMESNPLQRISGIKDNGKMVNITTTHEKLAQRIGKKIHSAFKGNLEIKWTEDRVTRVMWER